MPRKPVLFLQSHWGGSDPHPVLPRGYANGAKYKNRLDAPEFVRFQIGKNVAFFFSHQSEGGANVIILQNGTVVINERYIRAAISNTLRIVLLLHRAYLLTHIK